MKVAIIGAGALGLLLATKLEKLNIDYMIFNKGKVGRKILASGNGRCNISNTSYKENDYHNNKIALKILNDNQKDLFKYFEELNIYTKFDDEGRMYPISESSLSILNILLDNIKNKICDLEVNSIKKYKDNYFVNGFYGPFDKVVLATGSIASYKKPYNNYDYINDLGIKFNKFIPSLVGFLTSRKIKPLSGVRQKCNVKLYNDNKLVHEEAGEVIFKDNGISGIVIMNMSSYYNYLENKVSPYLELDFSYNKDYPNYKSVLNPKLYEFINDNNINVHKFRLQIDGVYDFEFAQVCKGGIDISMVNDNLTLKNDNNIFVGGELLDVDAVCGGYNLMFAFACAISISKEIFNEIQNK